uniref:hypothetical protein n=1 Tax=Rosistilla oblonga TaxID=2527990 RepID=UPI003A9869B5
KEEGRQEGRQEGAMIGQVLAYQQFLGRPTSGEEALLAMGADELRALFQQLDAEFRKLRR